MVGLHERQIATSPLGCIGLPALSAQDLAELLEVMDDRINTCSTLIATELRLDTRHAYGGDADGFTISTILGD
jgi:hypothetical protein